MKHLKLRGQYLTHNGKVKVTVLESENATDSFGGNDGDKHLFFSSSCCLIASSYIPDPPRVNNVDGLLDVHISIDGRGDYFICSVDEWNLIKESVDEYNKWGLTQ